MHGIAPAEIYQFEVDVLGIQLYAESVFVGFACPVPHFLLQREAYAVYAGAYQVFRELLVFVAVVQSSLCPVSYTDFAAYETKGILVCRRVRVQT